MAGEAREKCAVGGIISRDEEVEASALMYESLFSMQHRGAEASGIASQLDNGNMESKRDLGLVRDVYRPEDIRRLAGTTAIGHNRYSTSGNKFKHMQPYEDMPLGLAFSHNGNLPVTQQLETHLAHHNIRVQHFNDSEMMGLAIGKYISDGRSLPDAIELSYPLFRGAFSCVAMQDGVIAAFRDSKGIRPLAIGSFENGYAVTSETCGLDIIDAKYEREVMPGELVIITKDGIESRQLAEGESKLDIFEFVYFARHDSYLYGQRVNEVRRRFGEQLAISHPARPDNGDNILVVPVPDTSVPVAEGYADSLGLRHGQSIIKNRYIGRTFMQPSQQARRQQLRRKHTMISEAVEGKDLILIDDSIVRLNTIPGIVEQARECNARSITVLISSPPVRYPDFYGIDTPDQSELAAAHLTVEQMRDKVDCDYLGFLSISGMVEATHMPYDAFSLSCFNGEYPVGIGKRKDGLIKPVSNEYTD
ncbi:MAG: amidophosphoribosyltransferase [Patescibacteria group bacterium]|nr:amidophosphoribosyltransferase [Patescibacteria group bacterium]